MAQAINELQLMGNVGQNPEIRSTSDGTKYAKFSIATTDSWKDKNTGEKKEHTEWHNCTAWGQLAELVENYVTKGSKLFIKAKLKNRKYQDSEGKERSTTDIVINSIWLLDKKTDSGFQVGNSHTTKKDPNPLSDDDIPF